MLGIEQIGPVILVLALVAGTLWVLKRRGLASFSLPVGRGPARKRLESVERMPLTAQHSLHLVRVADRLLLIGIAPSGCSLLAECGAAEQPGPANAGGIL